MRFKRLLLSLLTLPLLVSLFFVGKIQAAPIPYKDAVLVDNPTAYWRFGESSGTSVLDQKTAYPGTYTNNPFLAQTGAITNDPDTAVSFNGTSSYASVPYNVNLNSIPFSVEAWAYPTGGTDYRTVVGSRDYPYGWIIYAQSASAGNNWSFWVNQGTNMLAVNGPQVALNTWTHIVATFDGTTATLYVNGQLAGSGSSSSYTPNTRNALTIGKGQPGQNFYFPGKIDEVSLYASALSPTQIASHYDSGINGQTATPTPSPLVTPSPSPSPSPSPTPPPGSEPPPISWAKAAITFTFDDAFVSANTLAAPAFAGYGFKATAYVNTQPPDNNVVGYLNWQQIQDLQNVYNWEVGSHSYSHVDLSRLSQSAVRDQLTRAVSDLTAHGINPESFATPFGAFNNTVNNEIARLHSSHRTAWNINNDWPIAAYDLRAISVLPTDTTANVQAKIDDAVANNKWLILNFHNIVEGTPDPNFLQYNLDDLKTILAYVKAKNIPVVTVKEVVNLWGKNTSLVPNGSFESGTFSEADNWTRSSSKVTINNSSKGVYPQPTRSAVINTTYRTSANTTLTSSKFAVDSLKLYRLKAFIRISSYSSGLASIKVQEYDINNNLVATKTLAGISGNQINNLYYDYTPSASATQIQLVFGNNPNSRLITEIDGVELKER